MSQAPATVTRPQPGPSERPPCYAAVDLGTNNCRLLIATPNRSGGFRIVEAFSRIVRLGEGLSLTGRLSPEAMDRAVAALAICADKVRRRQVVRLRAVATQACRAAENGAEFVRRVEAETGLQLSVIGPEEEARLAVAGCGDLFDPAARAVLVLDVGGGSSELSWVSLSRRPDGRLMRHVEAWLSVPMGVVTLAERHPEPVGGGPEAMNAWYETMVADISGRIDAFRGAEGLRGLFAEGPAQLIGTSGAITSLAGLHLGLARYDRSRVDGLWMTADECRAVADRLMALDRGGRAAQSCIGPDRSDLVIGGAAILEAVQRCWPIDRVRVADRGLREGLLLSLIKRRRRR